MSSTSSIDFSKDEVIELECGEIANTSDACKDKSCPLINVEEQNSVSEDIKQSDCSSERNEESHNDSSVRESAASPQPLLKVIFRDEHVSRLYRKRVKDLLEELVSSEDDKSHEAEDSCELVLEIWDNANESVNPLVDITSESEDSQDIICDTLFVVDTKPKLKDELDIPTYGKKYDRVFEKSEADLSMKDKPAPVRKKLVSCFNCSGNHNLKDCQEPWNQVAINQNKRNFNANGTGKSLRYHLESNQKFDHLVPGQLSRNLRKALGLRDNELPRHIYRMRILGYPPGWLEEARLQRSGLSLFNSDGVAEGNLNNIPDGNVDSSTIVDKDQYDIKKIYDFPGFNVPAPAGTRDDCRNYWAPEMQAVHSKQTMLLMLQGRKAEEGYTRRKMNTLPCTKSMEGMKLVPTEMEIDEADESVVECVPIDGLFVPPLPTIEPTRMALAAAPAAHPPPPPPPPSLPIATAPPPPPASECTDSFSQELPSLESPEDSNASPFSRASPSLLDLENMKKRLLVELEETSSQSNPETPVKSNSSNSTIKSGIPPPPMCSTPDTSMSECQNNHNTSQGSVITVDFGTPVLQSSSPYNRLPSSEKFSKDICDVINFENLPDATGKYKQMTKILQKVRDTLGDLRRE